VAPSWVENTPPYLELIDFNNTVYQPGLEISSLRYGGNGDIIGEISIIADFGCDISNYDNSTEGKIALILIGNCSLVSKVQLAESAKYSAVILYNPPEITQLPSSRVLDSPWYEGYFLATVPVIGASSSMGISLLNYKGLIHLITNTTTYTPTTINIWCDTDGDESNTIVVGAHLDSVLAGPGINDNGSGSAGILEILRQFYASGIKPANRLRFAWWGAEEEGLLGSRNYFRYLSQNDTTELAKIVAGLNLDMIGSPNYFPLIGVLPDNSPVPATAINGSFYITSLFESYYDTILQSPYDYMFMTSSSDHWAFLEMGIPAGRIHSGSSQIKSVYWKNQVGGIAQVAADPCYHSYCDTVHNINPIGLEIFTKALANVIYTIASDINIKTSLNSYKDNLFRVAYAPEAGEDYTGIVVNSKIEEN